MGALSTTIKIEFSKEDRERTDRLIAALEKLNEIREMEVQLQINGDADFAVIQNELNRANKRRIE